MASAGMDEPAEFDIVIQRGVEFSLPIVIEDANGPVDLTGFSHKCQVRTQPHEGGAPLLEVYVLPVAASAGSMRLWAAASSTAAITATATPNLPQRFFPGYYNYFAAPSATTGTTDKCYLMGVAKLYPRAVVRP